MTSKEMTDKEMTSKQIVNIVFENEHFVICDKPSLVLSTPDRFKSDRPCLGLELQNQLRTQIFPVHRLDFEVSGLVMYAKNARAHRQSQDWFQFKQLQKKYLARTRTQDFAHWPEKIAADRRLIAPEVGQKFHWKVCIQRGKKRSFESPHGEWADTQAEITKYENSFLDWALYPITGKPHQLRFELSRHGFPILGDELYGSKFQLSKQDWPYGVLALRAVELQFHSVGATDADRLGLPLIVRI